MGNCLGLVVEHLHLIKIIWIDIDNMCTNICVVWYPPNHVFLRDTNYQKSIYKILWRHTASLIWFLDKAASIGAIFHLCGVWSSRILVNWGQHVLHKFKPCLDYRGGHRLKSKTKQNTFICMSLNMNLKSSWRRQQTGVYVRGKEGFILRVPGKSVTTVTISSETKFNLSR